MNRERFKSVILSILVISSIVLTTQIWFDISIEGIFVMPENNEAQAMSEVIEYDKTKLIRPEKIVANLGEKGIHTLVYNSSNGVDIYNRIYEESQAALRKFMNKDNIEAVEKHSLNKLDNLREGRNIELIFQSGVDISVFKKLLELPDLSVNGPFYVDSIIISGSDNYIYICDLENDMVLEYKLKQIETAMSYMISLIENYENPRGIFLHEIDPDMYSRRIAIPISTEEEKLPILSVKSEIDSQTGVFDIIGNFFQAKTARSITDKNGTTIYTDGQVNAVRIEKSGTIEYIRYDIEANNEDHIGVDKAVEISNEFVNRHIGFPENSYLASITNVMENGKEIGYLIGYRYSSDNTPIVIDSNVNNNPIEVEVIGDQVKRYKRVVRILEKTQSLEDIKNPIEVLNIIYKNLSVQEGIKNMDVENIYLGYFEYSSFEQKLMMIPAWIIETKQEKEDGKKLNHQYIINAQTGVILKY